jgi:hypothetical protein
MDHRAHVAGPPPLRQPVPVITAAPSVEGSGRMLGLKASHCQDYFQEPRTATLFACLGETISPALTLLEPRSIKLRPAHRLLRGVSSGHGGSLMRKSALEVIGTIRLTFAGTLLVAGFSFVAPLPGRAVELVNPHAVLEETRRELIELDRRMERYRAERQKEEVRQKREAAEQARSDKALEEVRRKREIAEQAKRGREEKEREAQRRTQEAADREKSEAALRETQRQRDAAEEQKRARDVEEREAQQKQEIAEREKAEKATQEAQRKREAAAEQERARDKERATEKERREAGPKQRYSLHGEVSNRVGRRSACQQQAEEKGLSGRGARRYTRLCLSGLPVPDSLRR